MTALAGESVETVVLNSSSDIVMMRHRVRERAVQDEFTLVQQTRLVTAASELARNCIEHGAGGQAIIEHVRETAFPYRTGLRLVFVDHGPGIPDVERAMREGWSTSGALGLGLPGSRRLASEFVLHSTAAGTSVAVVFWRAP